MLGDKEQKTRHTFLIRSSFKKAKQKRKKPTTNESNGSFVFVVVRLVANAIKL
jgi:hypothetical protein